MNGALQYTGPPQGQPLIHRAAEPVSTVSADHVHERWYCSGGGSDGIAAEAAAAGWWWFRCEQLHCILFSCIIIFINHGWQNAAIYKGWMRGDETMSVATLSSLNNYVL